MKFFMPYAKSQDKEEEIYDGIKGHLGPLLGATFSDRRIRILHWWHDGEHYEAEVGKVFNFNNEPVYVILYEPARDLYHVCTTSRGIMEGGPILAGGHSITGAIDFETSR